MTVVLKRTDVLQSVDMRDCIAAVENAFCAEAHGQTLPAGVLGAHSAFGGFHVKTAGIIGDRQYYAAKINSNFPGNPTRHGRPTIQGVIALFDGETGEVLALLDSMSITALRTAAATAVAAKYLARPDAATVAIAGCGAQAPSQLRALHQVRPIRRVLAYDANSGAGEQLAEEMRAELACDAATVGEFRAAAAEADIIVTCTTARAPILNAVDVRPGSFIAAVGADSPEKQELEPRLLASNTVVVDALEQCASFGELHHAISDGLMARENVHATLADIVSHQRAGRARDDEITIFDSTGTGLEDVAAAAAAYERALALGLGGVIRLES